MDSKTNESKTDEKEKQDQPKKSEEGDKQTQDARKEITIGKQLEDKDSKKDDKKPEDRPNTQSDEKKLGKSGDRPDVPWDGKNQNKPEDRPYTKSGDKDQSKPDGRSPGQWGDRGHSQRGDRPNYWQDGRGYPGHPGPNPYLPGPAYDGHPGQHPFVGPPPGQIYGGHGGQQPYGGPMYGNPYGGRASGQPMDGHGGQQPRGGPAPGQPYDGRGGQQPRGGAAPGTPHHPQEPASPWSRVLNDYHPPYSPHHGPGPNPTIPGSPFHYAPNAQPISVQPANPFGQPCPNPAQPGYHYPNNAQIGIHPHVKGEFDPRGNPIPDSIKVPTGQPHPSVFRAPTHQPDPIGHRVEVSYPIPHGHQQWQYAGFEKYHPHVGMPNSAANMSSKKDKHSPERMREEKIHERPSREQEQHMAAMHAQAQGHPQIYHAFNAGNHPYSTQSTAGSSLNRSWNSMDEEMHAGHPWINPRDFDTKYPSTLVHPFHAPAYHAYPPGHPYNSHPPSPLVSHPQMRQGAPHTPMNHPGYNGPIHPLHVPLPGPWDMAPSPYHASPAHYTTPIHHPYAGAKYVNKDGGDSRSDKRGDRHDRESREREKNSQKKRYDDSDSDRDGRKMQTEEIPKKSTDEKKSSDEKKN